MKILQKISLGLKLSLFFTLAFFTNQKGFCQKNTLKITPLKVLSERINIAYERKIFGSWSAIADVQLWFLNKDKRVRETVFGSDDNPVLVSNNGARINLELRTYTKLLDREEKKLNFYFGFGGFIGSHEVNMVRRSYNFISSTFGRPRLIPELTASTNLISGGGYTNTGIQLAVGQTLKLEFGMMLGMAVVNQENNHLTIYNTDFYILEEERVTYDQDYSRKIAGLHIEPMLNLGFSF